jgi:hypothetical protein
VLANAGAGVVNSVVFVAMGLGAALERQRRPVVLMRAAIAGAVVGTMEWLVLRERVPRSGWWVLATLVGSLVAAFVGLLLFYPLEPSGATLYALVTGALAAFVEGGALVWLVRRPAESNSGS